MIKNRLSYKSKVHVFFGGGFVLALAINVAVEVFAGQTFVSALGGALRQIKPFEYILFFLFWYWLARGQHANARPMLTTLNLGSTNT